MINIALFSLQLIFIIGSGAPRLKV